MFRKPIIDPTKTWGIAENPFGDEPEVAGWVVWCYDPITENKTIMSEILDTKAQAEAELRNILEY